MRHILIWGGFALALIFTIAADAPIPQPSETELEAMFAKVLAESTPQWVSRATSADHWGPFLNWKLGDNPGTIENLPHAQQLQIGGYVAKPGPRVDVLGTFNSWYEYKKHFGDPPKNGQAVVTWRIFNNREQFKREYLAKPLEDLYGYYSDMVDPQTGKLYQSFDGSVAEPGGLIIHQFTDKADAVRAFGNRAGGDLFGQAPYTEGFEFIVMQADGKTTLDTACVMLRKDP